METMTCIWAIKKVWESVWVSRYFWLTLKKKHERNFAFQPLDQDLSRPVIIFPFVFQHSWTFSWIHTSTKILQPHKKQVQKKRASDFNHIMTDISLIFCLYCLFFFVLYFVFIIYSFLLATRQDTFCSKNVFIKCNKTQVKLLLIQNKCFHSNDVQ